MALNYLKGLTVKCNLGIKMCFFFIKDVFYVLFTASFFHGPFYRDLLRLERKSPPFMSKEGGRDSKQRSVDPRVFEGYRSVSYDFFETERPQNAFIEIVSGFPHINSVG